MCDECVYMYKVMCAFCPYYKGLRIFITCSAGLVFLLTCLWCFAGGDWVAVHVLLLTEMQNVWTIDLWQM